VPDDAPCRSNFDDPIGQAQKSGLRRRNIGRASGLSPPVRFRCRALFERSASSATNGGKVMNSSKQLKCVIAAVAAAGVAATSAIASPPSGIVIENIATGTLKGDNQQNSGQVKFQTKSDASTLVQKLTFSAGSYSGWHHHPGIVIVTVKEGTIRLMHTDCSVHEYGPGSEHGSVFIEGEQRVHEARSAGVAVVYATYVAPAASPPVFRVENDPPFCASSIESRWKKPTSHK
jgi:quercetin dioxygenase-like cupin family protein